MNQVSVATKAALMGLLLLGGVDADLLPLSGVPPGPHAVGFRHHVLRDSSRTYRTAPTDEPQAGGRPIAVSLWYPAAASSNALRMTVGDYAKLDDVREAATPVMNASMSAVQGAAPIGRWPLVLFPHTGPAAESVMAEFIASHGFVVAGLPSRDAEVGPYRLSVANIDAIGRDLAFVTQALRRESFVDARPPAVLGMSNGALGAIALELQAGPLAGIISLDGTIGERIAAQALPRLARGEGAKLVAPLLHFYSPANDYLDFTELRAQARPFCQLAELAGMAHSDFLADAMFRAAAHPDSEPVRNNARAFAWMARRTLEFLLARFDRGTLPPSVAATDAEAGALWALVPCAATVTEAQTPAS
jgi:hypothetical protein